MKLMNMIMILPDKIVYNVKRSCIYYHILFWKNICANIWRKRGRFVVAAHVGI